jgi:hypothetical protein
MKNPKRRFTLRWEPIGTYLVGEAGITVKTTSSETICSVSTLEPSKDATVVSEKSETVPSAELATRFALASGAFDGSAGFG